MNKEQPPAPELFAFNKQEKLWGRMSDSRFRGLLADKETTIHQVQPDSNSFGTFLFVTVSRPGEGGPQYLSFYGMGFHEFRERWITQEWAWFQAHPFAETQTQKLSREEAEELLQARREAIAPYVREDTQTSRGRLYELIADISDEDGALAEMEDLGDLWDYLADGLD